MWVVCTAGHVDHGKSTLVAALTGQQPDRLAEEQARGLTIDLGFAWTTLEGIGDVAFVDLPGHERFVPNMLAGAGPVSTALFVVAADEGWMPQSAEHLAILDLLGVDAAVVALTRVDLVDAETAEIAEALLVDQLEGTVLAEAPVVPVSGATGQGMEDLRSALRDSLLAAPAPADLGRPRLWVDRAFSVKGAGTVVTGTLAGGQIAVGDRLRLLGDGREVRVRGLQSLERVVEAAEPGWRVAVNIVGADVDEVGRGDALVVGGWAMTGTADMWCRPVEGQALGRRGAWTVHTGTAAVPAELFPVAGVDLTAPGPVRVELAGPLPLAVGDRVVLRESGRGATVGGGTVLDPDPGPRVRGRAAREVRLAALDAAVGATGPAARLSALVTLRGVGPTADLTAAANAPAGAVPEAAAVVEAGDHLLTEERWTLWSGLAANAVASAHQAAPARAAIDREVPRKMLAQAECPTEAIDDVIAEVVRRGRLEVVRGGIAVPGHEPRLTVAQQSARTALLAALDEAGFSPPDPEEVLQRTGADADLVATLVADGQLVRLAHALTTASVIARAVEVLRRLHAESGPFTASAARDTLGTSRKHALPLLEALDAAGHTVRDGDLRRVS